MIQRRAFVFSSLVIPAAAATFFAFSPIQETNAQTVPLTCPAIYKIEQVFLNQHINFKDMTPEIENRTIEQYVKRLDTAKIYLLDSDVKQIKKDLKGLFSKLKAGDCGALDRVQALFMKRVDERLNFATKTLGSKKFKFDPKTEITLDPESRKYAKSAKEADAYQSKYLQFQVSNYLATGLQLEEATKNVIKNYQRVAKRLKETKKEDLYSSYLDSFGHALDPHSSFFSKDALDDFEISMSLSLEGIGATLSNQDGFTVIEQLIEGGSAKASGMLQPQDKITSVGQVDGDKTVEMEDVVDLDLRDVVKKIRGKKGTKVRLLILRKKGESGPERFVVDLVRDKIKLEDEAASINFLDRDVNGEKKRIAVLQLPSFYAEAKRGGRSSASDLKKLIKEAKEKAADAVVLDLSQNGGGSLDDAVKIGGLFIKTGAVVKQSTGSASSESALEDRDPAVDWDGPLVVLTSRVSASASEIVAGAMKDYGRAVVVGGDHTFGKGSIQSVVPLPPGLGAVKVTVGMFFTPGGFSTQHRGVEADIVLPGAFSTDEIGEKHLDHSLPAAKLKEFLSPEAYVTSGPGAWKKVDAATINQLKARSEVRVSKNADFQKIVDELKKNKNKKARVIKLADALKDSKEKKGEAEQKKNQSKEDKVADYLQRADLQEAANVAADLLALQRGITLTDASSTVPTSVVGGSEDVKKKQ